MFTLYLDLSFGISGDMLLAALCDLGLDPAPLAAMLGQDYVSHISNKAEIRQGIKGRRCIPTLSQDQPLRHLPQIIEIISGLSCPESVRERSIKAFQRLAGVEAAVHGIEPEKVHFHELGAVDTILDVVGCFWGLEQLQITRVSCSSLPWFTGTVHCAHGEISLPAPATLHLLEGKPVYPTAFTFECITPTGALLIDQLSPDFGQGPEGILLRSGLGYGGKETGGGLRAYLLEPQKSFCRDDCAIEHVWLLESNIDHLSGEELGYCFDALFEAGALDVLFLPGVMKKSRPGGQLQVMCVEPDLEKVQAAFFRCTLSLGVRRTRVERAVIPRAEGRINTDMGELEAKICLLDGVTYQTPEYEALAKLAKKTGRSVAQLRRMLSIQSD